MNAILEKVKDFAEQAHGSQTRKYTPEPYIIHPVAVMDICRNYTADITLLSAALLHDVLEDTVVSAQELADFLHSSFSEEEAEKILSLVIELTDVYTKDNYPQWNRRQRKQKELQRFAAVSAEAQTIKYADILHNSKELADQDPSFAPLYLHESIAILQRAEKGNRHLHQLAMEIVRYNLRQLKKGS